MTVYQLHPLEREVEDGWPCELCGVGNRDVNETGRPEGLRLVCTPCDDLIRWETERTSSHRLRALLATLAALCFGWLLLLVPLATVLAGALPSGFASTKAPSRPRPRKSPPPAGSGIRDPRHGRVCPGHFDPTMR